MDCPKDAYKKSYPSDDLKSFLKKNINKHTDVWQRLGRTDKMLFLLLSATQQTHKPGYFHLEQKAQVTWDTVYRCIHPFFR